jgi:DNA-binding MarR family transcriptional regulator
MISEDPIKLILETLRKHSEGLTLLSLAELTGLHRHTATKYINELLGAGFIYQRNVGVAKLCYLIEKVENQTDEKVLEELKVRRIGNKTQLKIIATIMIVTFLLSETAILAYQNTSLFNETNLSNFSLINTSPLTGSNYPNLSQNSDSIINITNITLDENLNLSEINISTEKNDSIDNLSVEILNKTIQEINETLQDNQSIIETNLTISEPINETQETPQKSAINFEIELNYPQRTTRGEIIPVKASAINTGSSTAKNVVLEWKLPDGFSAVSGNESEFCGDIEQNSECDSQINLKTDVSTVLGLKEIKVVVNYEE